MMPLAEAARAFWRDGFVLLEQALDPEWMSLTEKAIQRGRRSPSPHANLDLFAGTEEEFWVDYCNYAAVPEMQMLVRHAPIVDIVSTVLGTSELFLVYDETFIKGGGSAHKKRTPFHQDTTYWPMRGKLSAVFWITLEDQTAEESLEMVRGTHLGPTYNSFDPMDRASDAGLQPEGVFPPLPDIDALRDQFDIVSVSHRRGDVLMFHPNIIHGGGSPGPNGKRSTLALKFFGDDVVYAPKPVTMPAMPGIAALLQDGDPMRSPWNPRVFPRPTTPLW